MVYFPKCGFWVGGKCECPQCNERLACKYCFRISNLNNGMCNKCSKLYIEIPFKQCKKCLKVKKICKPNISSDLYNKNSNQRFEFRRTPFNKFVSIGSNFTDICVKCHSVGIKFICKLCDRECDRYNSRYVSDNHSKIYNFMQYNFALICSSCYYSFSSNIKGVLASHYYQNKCKYELNYDVYKESNDFVNDNYTKNIVQNTILKLMFNTFSLRLNCSIFDICNLCCAYTLCTEINCENISIVCCEQCKLKIEIIMETKRFGYFCFRLTNGKWEYNQYYVLYGTFFRYFIIDYLCNEFIPDIKYVIRKLLL